MNNIQYMQSGDIIQHSDATYVHVPTARVVQHPLLTDPQYLAWAEKQENPTVEKYLKFLEETDSYGGDLNDADLPASAHKHSRLYLEQYAKELAELKQKTDAVMSTVGVLGGFVLGGATVPVWTTIAGAGLGAGNYFDVANVGSPDWNPGWKRTTQAYNDLKSGEVLDPTVFAGNVARDALDVVGIASPILAPAIAISSPAYRRIHAHHAIKPWNYGSASAKAKAWVKSMLTLKKPGVYDTPTWVDDLIKTDLPNQLDHYLRALDDLKAAHIIVARGREEASRIYNGLPMKYGYYKLIGDDLYTYNLDQIQHDYAVLSGGKPFKLYADYFSNPGSAYMTRHKGADVITSAGGNLTANDVIAGPVKLPNGSVVEIRRIQDTWDAHPFKRPHDRFLARLDKKSQSFTDFIKRSEILKRWLGDRKFVTPKNNRFLNWLDRKLSTLEVGTITGAKPFEMVTDVPYIYLPPKTVIMNGKYIKVHQPNPILGKFEDGFYLSGDGNYYPKYNEFGLILLPPIHKQGGTIHIKKKNRGKFTASAKAAGEGVQEHAHKVMNDPNATPLQKKRANFAANARKWKHRDGGKLNYLNLMENGKLVQ